MKIRRYLDEIPLRTRFRVDVRHWIIPSIIRFEIELDKQIRENIKINRRILK